MFFNMYKVYIGKIKKKKIKYIKGSISLFFKKMKNKKQQTTDYN